MEVKSQQVDLEEWESLMRHPNFSKVKDVLSQRIESLQMTVLNRAKQCMDLDSAVETAGDMRAMCELNKVLDTFESLKTQILQQKGVIRNDRQHSESVL